MRHHRFDHGRWHKTWAAVPLEQGLPYVGMALTEVHYQEVLARKVEARTAENPSALT